MEEHQASSCAACFRRHRRSDHRTNPKIHTNQYTKLPTKALRRSSQLNPGEAPWEASSAGKSQPGDSGTTSTYHPQFLVSNTKGTAVAAPATIATTGIEQTNMITTWPDRKSTRLNSSH